MPAASVSISFLEENSFVSGSAAARSPSESWPPGWAFLKAMDLLETELRRPDNQS
jgi:hypothetical protein